MGKIVDSYIINKNTVRLVPYKVEGGNRIFTHVFEVGQEVFVRQNPIVIIKRSRRRHGLRVNMVKKMERQVCPNQRKIPYVISLVNPIILFQTCSDRLGSECWYVSFLHVKSVHKHGSGARIYFYNGDSLLVKCSKASVKKMLDKSLLLFGVYRLVPYKVL